MAWVWYSINLRKPRIDLKHIHMPKKPLNQGHTFSQYMDVSVWVVGVILTCSESNAPSFHMRDGPHGGTHAWGPPLM